MKTIRYIQKGIITCLILSLVSCNNWLDVAPDDRIMENELFKDQAGFIKALNGVYSELNSTTLYGLNLSAGMIDAMAQYYNCKSGAADRHRFEVFLNYNYEDSDYKTKLESIWSKTYELIANCNAIIDRCGDANPVLADTYHRMIKAEAIGLRAVLHLDLLRMYGPVWTDADKATLSIPYMTKANREVQPLLPASQVLEHITADLKMAAELIHPVDPVVTLGTVNKDEIIDRNDMNYRQFRLNYYAMKALLARAYLWGKDTESAGRYAKEVISAVTSPENPLFPLVDAGYVGSHTDHVFSPEILFSLYNTSRKWNIFDQLFAPTLSSLSLMTLSGNFASGRIDYLYDDQNDYRFKMWTQATVSNVDVTYFTKYQGTMRESEAGSLHPYMIPMIRLSELYLIAAECESSPEAAAKNWLDPLRASRNCVNLQANSQEELQAHIQGEYAREFIGEGQLFFYFKRKQLANIPDGTTANYVKNIQLSEYVFPLPDSEISQRAEE